MKLNDAEIELVMKTELFRGLPRSVLMRIIAVSDCTVEEYSKNDIVFSKTSFTRSLGIVLGGKLRVTKENADKRPIVMSTLQSGSLFGAAALFNSQGEYVTQITAIEHSRILFLPQRLIERMIEREPEIAENYIRYLSERILFLNRKIYFLTAGTAEQRLASFLLDNLSEGEYSEMPMPMHRLADALNMSRASLYRAFDLLIESGAVSKQGKLVCISNAELLNQL
ncbi:MAG: Crp/Fnr family transcriptional regulator [Oscillospiraceae bacterium]|nr:Crp/Fnr family transcriptional regulator [Oscillospiraceae bacterium]